MDPMFLLVGRVLPGEDLLFQAEGAELLELCSGGTVNSMRSAPSAPSDVRLRRWRISVPVAKRACFTSISANPELKRPRLRVHRDKRPWINHRVLVSVSTETSVLVSPHSSLFDLKFCCHCSSGISVSILPQTQGSGPKPPHRNRWTSLFHACGHVSAGARPCSRGQRF